MGRLALSFLVTATLLARVAWGADDPFVGEWKLDSTKSRLIDQMKVEGVGPNKYDFDFGGTDETVVADGSDQPGYGGTTLAVTAGPDSWKVVRKQDGRVMLHADWTLSQDGKSLTDHFTAIGSDGSTSTEDLLYARTAGTSGFTGTWVRTVDKMDPFVLKVQPYEAEGLAFSYLGKTKDMRFDGKYYPTIGSSLPAGLTFSAHRVSRSDLEVTDKFQGKLLDTQEITLSSDLKTLTMTVRTPGKRLPNVLVFERQ